MLSQAPKEGDTLSLFVISSPFQKFILVENIFLHGHLELEINHSISIEFQ